MSTAFGDISTMSDDSQEPSASQLVNGADVEAIDPNDPRLTSEVLTDNAEADAYAILPPLPDGKWRAKAKQVDIKDSKGQTVRVAAFSFPKMANGRPFLATNVEFSVIDHSGTNDGIKLTEYWVKSLIDDRKGTSQAQTITRKCGVRTPEKSTDKERMDLLLKTLSSEPELVIETAWEAACQTCQEAAKKKGERAPRPFLNGMHRFKQAKGKPDPIAQCPVCHSQVRAQPRIVGFYELNAAPAPAK
jgi:hypothetical protein